MLGICELILNRVENSMKAFTDTHATHHTVPGTEGRTEAETNISAAERTEK